MSSVPGRQSGSPKLTAFDLSQLTEAMRAGKSPSPEQRQLIEDVRAALDSAETSQLVEGICRENRKYAVGVATEGAEKSDADVTASLERDWAERRARKEAARQARAKRRGRAYVPRAAPSARAQAIAMPLVLLVMVLISVVIAGFLASLPLTSVLGLAVATAIAAMLLGPWAGAAVFVGLVLWMLV